MLPLVGASAPAMRLNNVDLPAPLGPSTARRSPGATSRSMSLTATTPPKRRVNPRTRSTFSLVRSLTRTPGGRRDADGRSGDRGSGRPAGQVPPDPGTGAGEHPDHPAGGEGEDDQEDDAQPGGEAVGPPAQVGVAEGVEQRAAPRPPQPVQPADDGRRQDQDRDGQRDGP